MSKTQKSLLISAIVILLFIIILLLMLLNIINNQEYNNNIIYNNTNVDNIILNENRVYNSITENNVIEDIIIPELEIEYKNNKISNLSNRTEYFAIKKVVSNYIENVGYNKQDVLKNVVSNKYISKYNINDITKISTDIPKAEQNQTYTCIITQALTAQVADTQKIYIVSGKGRIKQTNSSFNFKILIVSNTQENIYTIYPNEYLVSNNLHNLTTSSTINFEKEEMTKNANNKLKYEVKSNNVVAIEYFNNYKELLLYHTEEAYNKLDKEYANKRFGSYQKFKDYLNKSKKTLQDMQIKFYDVKINKDYTDYICADQYDKLYIFRQKGGMMVYTAFLDNYTIMTKEELEKYDEYDEYNKAKYNLIKFINMVNTKDYNAIYNVLNKTFRENNYKTVEELEKYILNNFYNVNSIEIKDIEDEEYEYYVFECKLINIKNSSESKTVTVVLDQSEGTQFTMSFSFME